MTIIILNKTFFQPFSHLAHLSYKDKKLRALYALCSSVVKTSLVWLLTLNALSAQNTQIITLEKALELGGANNLTIQNYQQRQELAKADLTKAKEWWLPQIYAGLQTHQLAGAAMNGNGNFFIDIDRNNLWAGLGLDMTWDFKDGIYQQKIVKLKAAATTYQTQAARNQTLLNIIENYYDFITAQLNYQTYQQLVAQADTLSQQINIQVDAGLRYQTEYLLAKSSLNHLKVQMLNAKADYGKQSAILVQLLNLDPNIKLVSIDTIMQPLDLQKPATDFAQAYQNRPELKQGELQLEALEIDKKSVTTGLLVPEFRLNAYTASFGSLSGDVNPIDPVRFPNPQQLYGTRNLNMALMWEIPLGALTHKGTVKQKNEQIALQQNQIAQVKAAINGQIIAAREAINAAREQMDIAKEGSELAHTALQQSYQRQALGTIRPFEILQAQEIYIKARLDYIQAVASFNKGQYQLFTAHGNDL